jgi:putative chitinase
MSYQTYQVKAGDSLSKIAAQFGTTVSAIAQGNGIADPNKISVGQELIIKTPDSAADVLPEVVVTAARSKSTAGSSTVLAPQASASMLQEWLKPPKIYIAGAVIALAAWALLGNDD